MTLSDLERRHARGQIFQRNLDTLAPFDLERPNLTGYNTCREERILMGSAVPLSQGGWPNAPQFWRFPSIYVYTL